MEPHGAPKPLSSAVRFFQACGVVFLPSRSLRERVARNTNALVARFLADRSSRAFAVVYSRLTSIHTHFHRRLMQVSHAGRGSQQWVAEQSSMQRCLVVDILAEMWKEDMLMEAGASAVDPRALWLLN